MIGNMEQDKRLVELTGMLTMVEKMESIDKIIISCNQLKNGNELRKVLSEIKNELAEKLIFYYNKQQNTCETKEKAPTSDSNTKVDDRIEKLKRVSRVKKTKK